MEILKGLSSVSGKVVYNSVEETGDCCTLRYHGKFTIAKGDFIQSYSFWSDVSKMNYEGFLSVEDLDYQVEETTLGGLVIDNINAFKDMLTKSGLTNVAKSIEIDHSEIMNFCCRRVSESKTVKRLFKAPFKVYDCLTDAEKKVVKLEHIIGKFDKSSDYDKKQFGIETESEDNIPTEEELIAYKETLT
jgi:hypothetical protein